MENIRIDNRNFFLNNTSSGISADFSKDETPKSMLRCHYHSSYEIYYLYRGERIYFIHNKTYHIKEGTLVLIPPNVVHATLNAEGNIYERYLLSFSKGDIWDVTDSFSDINFFEAFEKNIYVLNLSQREQLLVEAILQSMTDTKDTIEKKFLLTQLLFYVNMHPSTQQEISKKHLSNVQKTITEVIAYINNNFNQELTLENVANNFFIDSCYLSRTFKKVVGISFVNYINNIRVMEAKKLLLSSDESITSIAESVGFRSNTHFGRIFKRTTSVSPLQYRKSKNKPM